MYQREPDKTCFQHDMTYHYYGDFKDLSRKKQLLIKYLIIKHLIWLQIQNMMIRWVYTWIASMVYRIFDEKSTAARECFSRNVLRKRIQTKSNGV